MNEGSIKMIWNRSDISKEPFEGSSENEGFHKRTFLKLMAFACLGMGPFLSACSILNTGDTNQESTKKKDSLHDSVLKAARPPIDLAAPAETETATFALG
jgi:hypothetical protein